MNIRMLRISVLTGLGLGMATGTIETAVIAAGLRAPGDLGNLFLVDAVVWGLIGLAAGFLVFLAGTMQERDEKQQRAVASLRVIILLSMIALGLHANSRFLPPILHWKSIAFNGALLVLGGIAWIASPRLSSSSIARTLFLALSRAWPILIIVSAATGVIARPIVASTRAVILSRFSPQERIPVAHEPHAPRVMVLGLDSATWKIVDPLVQSGKMPNLAGLMRRGKWGVLRSYKTSLSPVVWTSIMTGKAAEDHGITDWAVAMATNRRVKPVWEIAEEHGYKSAVVNVPGTFPVLGDCDVMLSGFPLPTATYNNRGWLFTTRPGHSDDILPTERLPLEPSELGRGQEWRGKFSLADLPVSLPSSETAPALFLRRINPRWTARIQKALVPIGFGRMDIILRNDPSTAGVTLEGSTPSGDRLFSLLEGQWSDWLVAEINGRRNSFKVNFLNTGPDEISFYVTPLYPFPDEALAKPADWLTARMVTPYVAEGVGWQIFLEPRLLETLAEHLTDIAASRMNAGIEILKDRSPDLFVYIVTLTDRIQHPMLKFLLPAEYERLADELGGAYEENKPTEPQIRQFGHVIEDTYVRADQWIGQLLAYADTSTTVVVVSDHGASSGRHDISPSAGIHHPEGIYVIAREGHEISSGPLSATRGPELILEDITPTVLGLLGISPARDMRGAFADFVLPAGSGAPDLVDTYESSEGDSGKRERLGKSAEEQLRSLGYIQ